MQLTERILATLPGVRIYYDRAGDRRVPGLGFRVTAKGTRSWTFDYSSAGRRRRVSIGRWPNLTLEMARARARKLQTDVAERLDPLEQKRQARTQVQERGERTFRRLVEIWIDQHARLHKRSLPNDRSTLKCHLFPRFGDRPVAEISSADIKQMMVAMHSTPCQANRARALLSTLLNFAVELEWITANPITRVKRFREEPRLVQVSRADLDRLYAAVDAHPNRQAANLIKLLVWTGARLDEAMGATWSEFDLEARRWVRPAERTKQKRNSVIPLNDLALGLLREMYAANGEHRYVFHGVRPGDRLHDINGPWHQIRKEAGLPTLRLHDLRHIFCSFAIQNGTPIEAIGSLVGHSSSSTSMTRRYSHWAEPALQAATARAAAALAPPTR